MTLEELTSALNEKLQEAVSPSTVRRILREAGRSGRSGQPRDYSSEDLTFLLEVRQLQQQGVYTNSAVGLVNSQRSAELQTQESAEGWRKQQESSLLVGNAARFGALAQAQPEIGGKMKDALDILEKLKPGQAQKPTPKGTPDILGPGKSIPTAPPWNPGWPGPQDPFPRIPGPQIPGPGLPQEPWRKVPIARRGWSEWEVAPGIRIQVQEGQPLTAATIERIKEALDRLLP